VTELAAEIVSQIMPIYDDLAPADEFHVINLMGAQHDSGTHLPEKLFQPSG
jgi:hypothetical protein